MFGFEKVKRILKKQGLWEEEYSDPYYGRISNGPAINLRELETKIDLLLEHEGLKLEKVTEHYRLREKEN